MSLKAKVNTNKKLTLFKDLPIGSLFITFCTDIVYCKVNSKSFMEVKMHEKSTLRDFPIYQYFELRKPVIPLDYIRSKESSNKALVRLSSLKRGDMFICPIDEDDEAFYIYQRPKKYRGSIFHKVWIFEHANARNWQHYLRQQTISKAEKCENLIPSEITLKLDLFVLPVKGTLTIKA